MWKNDRKNIRRDSDFCWSRSNALVGRRTMVPGAVSGSCLYSGFGGVQQDESGQGVLERPLWQYAHGENEQWDGPQRTTNSKNNLIIRWDWIPILTQEILVPVIEELPCKSWSGKQKTVFFHITSIPFYDANTTHIQKMFKAMLWSEGKGDTLQKEILISDNRLDRLLHLNHLVQLRINNKDKDLLNLELEIWPSPFLQRLFFWWEKESLIRGKSEIHASGLVKHVLDKYPNLEKYPHPEEQMHKLIRDVFHKHVHHSSDMPLPPVKASDSNDAIKQIALLYLTKFITYKGNLGKIRVKDALENVMRAQGEIEYACAFLNMQKSNLHPYFFEFAKKSLESLGASFKVLERRFYNNLQLALNSTMILLTLFMLFMMAMIKPFPTGTPIVLAELGVFTLKSSHLIYASFLTVAIYFITKVLSILSPSQPL